MLRLLLRLVPLALLLLMPTIIQGAAPPILFSDVPGYSTVETAIKAKAGKATTVPVQAGYLGVQLAGGKDTNFINCRIWSFWHGIWVLD